MIVQITVTRVRSWVTVGSVMDQIAHVELLITGLRWEIEQFEGFLRSDATPPGPAGLLTLGEGDFPDTHPRFRRIADLAAVVDLVATVPILSMNFAATVATFLMELAETVAIVLVDIVALLAG